jgi:AcrR family transcriptional regulator
MVNIGRKEREYLEREQRILEIARPMVVREGYHALNMNRIAEELEYSKGTVYNHFPCKEEIILALAIQTLEARTSMFQRGAKFVGRSRERMQAIGVACELFARLHPEHFVVEQLVRIPSIWEKTSARRQQLLYRAETGCLTLVSGIVHEGVGAGDLVLPEGLNAEELVFGLWSMTFGAYSMLATNSNLPALGVVNGYDAVRSHLRHMLDGYHWRPLDAELDYDLVAHRVLELHFADEMAQAAQMAMAANHTTVD